MNKKQLIAKASKNCGFPQKVTANVLDSILATIHESLADNDEVLLVDFGKFHRIECIARVGRNPKDGSPLPIPAKHKVRFTPGTALSRAVI